MISRVLVPMDDSEMSERALRHALDVYADADIVVLHVVGEPSQMMGQATALALADDVESAARDHARAITDRAEAIAAEYDRDIDTAIAVGHPVRQILDRAEDVDAIVMGTHGGTLAERLFVGDIAKTVFRRSPVPVTAVR
ncbi:MAG: universal stress protein [Halorubrum sp.]